MSQYQEIAYQIEHGVGVPEPIRTAYFEALSLISSADPKRAYWFRRDPTTGSLYLVEAMRNVERAAEADPRNYYGIWFPGRSPSEEVAARVAVGFNPDF